MSFYQRSTNEQALARHRFKRSRGVALRAVEQTAAGFVPVVATSPSSVPITPRPIILPPIGTAVFPPQVSSLPATSSDSVLGYTVPTETILTSASSIPSTPSPSIPPSNSTTPVQVTSSPSSTSTSSHTVSSGTPAQTDVANSSSTAKSQTLSSGAVGGIVVAIAIFALVGFAFFARRRALNRRTAKRNSWGAGLVPALENKRATVYAGQSSAGQSIVPAFERLDIIPKTSVMSQSLPAPTIPRLTAPASSYDPGSPVSTFIPTSPRGATSLRSVAYSTYSGSPAAAELAIVARTFIPSLPDELHIANGEQIRILNAYDDGWAFCHNSRGEQGVVPLECLQRSTSVPAEMQLYPQSQLGGSESNRTSQRQSSLTAHTAKAY